MWILPVVLFMIGLLLAVRISWESYRIAGDDKRGAVAAPFAFFVAAITLQYILNSM